MSFTAAYLEIEATYLVPGASPLRTAADVDRDGVRAAAPARANYELFLSRNLKRAQLVSTRGATAAFALLVTGTVDALAGLTQGLLALALTTWAPISPRICVQYGAGHVLGQIGDEEAGEGSVHGAHIIADARARGGGGAPGAVGLTETPGYIML